MLGVEFQPLLQPAFRIGENGLGRTFRLAHAAIDALAGINHQHVLTLIEAIDRTYLYAVHIFATDAGIGDDIGHFEQISLASCGAPYAALRRASIYRPSRF